MRQLGIAIVIAACIAVIVPVVFHMVDPSRAVPDRSGAVLLTPTAATTTVPGASATPGAAATPVLTGAELATSAGCAACHTTDGTRLVGPTWKALAGSQLTLTDGTTVTADDAYLRDSIVHPGAHVANPVST